MMPSLAAAEHRLPARSRIDQARMIITVLPLGLAPLAHEGGVSAGGASRAAGETWEIAARLCGRVARRPRRGRSRGARSRARRVRRARAQRLHLCRPRRRQHQPDLYASVLAALCSLSGPIHGGACDRIESMFAELDAGTRIEQALDAFGAKHSLPPGFGHTIYPHWRSPCGAAQTGRSCDRQTQGAQAVRDRTQVRGSGLEARPPFAQSRFLSNRMRPHGRLSSGMPAAIFAMGRAAGWIAHSLEQSADNRLIRPPHALPRFAPPPLAIESDNSYGIRHAYLHQAAARDQRYQTARGTRLTNAPGSPTPR